MSKHQRRSLRSRARRSLGTVIPLSLGGVAALAAMGLVPSGDTKVGPATLGVRAYLGGPRTELRVPPFGTISARTHRAPLSLEVTLNEIDPVAVGRTLSSAPDDQALRRTLEQGLRKAATTTAARIVLGGAVLGAIAGAVMPGRRLKTIALGAAGGLGVTALAMGSMAWGYRLEAFEQPRFSGTLERAPQIIEAVRKSSDSLQELRSRFEAAASRLQEVITLVGEPIHNPHIGSTAILHVSDIHSNPLGVEITRQLATSFGVDAVLDTGDLTSFGEPIEERIGSLIAGMDVPYLFVPGNHDSPPIRAALSAIENVTVLDGEVAEVGGVRILGWADPTFTARGGVTSEEQIDAHREVSPQIALAVRRLLPDVLAVHNVEMARDSFGIVDVIATGHGHRKKFAIQDGTILLAVGSTGATGLGSFLVEADLDYEAEVLYFADGRLAAVDYVRFRGLGRDFDIERKVLEPAEQEVSAS